jgi:hypothetical protein
MKRATTDRPTALVSVSFSFVGARALRFEREPAGGAGGDRHGRMGSDDGTTTHWVAFCMCPRGASPRLESTTGLGGKFEAKAMYHRSSDQEAKCHAEDRHIGKISVLEFSRGPTDPACCFL